MSFEEMTDTKSLTGVVLILIICATIIISLSIIKDCAVQTKKQGLPESPQGEMHESH